MENNNKSNSMTSAEPSGKYLFILVILVIFGGIAFVMFSEISYINKLQNQVAERDSLIRKLTISDNLVKDYFDIKYDSTEYTTSYSLKNSKKTQVIRTVTETKIMDPTFQQGDRIITLDELLRDYDNSNHQIHELANQSNSLREKHNTLVEKHNALLKKYSATESENKSLKSGLNMIKANYGISYAVTSDSTKYIFSITNSTKIDSALLLLPYYRDRLLYNETDKNWTIFLPTKGESAIINKSAIKKK